MNIVKSSSKLNGGFITLCRAPRNGAVDGQYRQDNYSYKRWNSFYNPTVNSRIFDGADPDNTPADRGQGFQDMTRNPTWQIQIANKKYPEFECQSMAETMYYLRRAIHFMNPNQEAMSITYKRFREDKFIIGISYEKMADINFTGVNTKMGSLLVLKFKGTNGVLAPDEAVQRESRAIVYD